MKDRTKKFALGTFIAAIGGYVAGILTAPKSGKETRKDIKDFTSSELEKLHIELDEAVSKAKQISGSAKEQAVQNAEKVKAKVNELLTNTKAAKTNDRDLKKAMGEAKTALTHLKKYIAQYGKAAKDAVKK